ncbi:hypothetical protein J8I26_19435 [Herbaspirillum sp. LeCh32-8]|uniref:hypothetical protein n=1 Tax=Herbaspirillum sp. LeCh32-8 TaxID=2821356 RepID=UPI001AE5B0E9|nr:hypothetical protein [Herbaspirillum sp. LeCh32-8]MBP0600292.1 hypothetical protein [Herbaspirillum sp. LeCh32-8]
MDALDKITLVLMVCLVAVALLFPLSSGHLPQRKERRKGHDRHEADEQQRR